MTTGTFCQAGIMLLMTCMLTTHTVHAASREDAFRSVWHPTWHGERLAYCSQDKRICGLTMANEYCKALGYQRANQAVKAPNVGLTNYFEVPARCRGWQCDGFMLINCVEPLKHTPPSTWHYRFRDFVYPRYNNFRVDWCYDGKQGCGRKVAASFCRRMGYLNVKSYKMQTSLPATKAIGNDSLCFGDTCKGFLHIACAR